MCVCVCIAEIASRKQQGVWWATSSPFALNNCQKVYNFFACLLLFLVFFDTLPCRVDSIKTSTVAMAKAAATTATTATTTNDRKNNSQTPPIQLYYHRMNMGVYGYECVCGVCVCVVCGVCVCVWARYAVGLVISISMPRKVVTPHFI